MAKKKAPKRVRKPDPKQGQLTPQQRHQARLDWLRGHSFNELADKYEISRQSARNLCLDIRLELEADEHRTREVMLDELRELRAFAYRELDRCLRETVEETKYEEIFGSVKTPGRDEPLAASQPTAKLFKRHVRQRNGHAVWVDLIKWSIELEAKLKNWLQPVHLEQTVEFRWAGADPDQLDEQMVTRLVSLVEQHKAKARAITVRPEGK